MKTRKELKTNLTERAIKISDMYRELYDYADIEKCIAQIRAGIYKINRVLKIKSNSEFATAVACLIQKDYDGLDRLFEIVDRYNGYTK